MKSILCALVLAAIIFIVLRGFYFYPLWMIMGTCFVFLILFIIGLNTPLPTQDIYDNNDKYECHRPHADPYAKEDYRQ